MKKREGEIKRLIKEAQNKKKQVVAFGMGVWGTGYGLIFLDWLNIKIDFISDSDSSKTQKVLYKGIKVIDKDRILKFKDETIVFVNIGQYYIEQVVKELEKNLNLRIIKIDEIMNLDIIVNKFYEVDKIKTYLTKENKCDYGKYKTYKIERKKKVAIYTCIINDYDEIHEPEVVESNCDYFLISDKKPSKLKIFQWIDARKVIPVYITDPAAMNRYCKMYGDAVFPDYEYSIYIDGKIKLVNNISHYIEQAGESGLAIHRHGFIDCIYTEGIRMVGCGTCSYEGVKKQMQRYILEGMPRHFGQYECAVIARIHNNDIGKKIMKEWFEEYMEGEKRDQFTLSYILWKNGLDANSIGYIYGGIPWNENKDFVRDKVHCG